MKLLGIFGVVLLTLTSGCALKSKSSVYREPPEWRESAQTIEPYIIIEPTYPRKAAMKGIEGWAQIQFKLDDFGQPIELYELDSFPKGVFVDMSIKTLKRWKFKAVDTAMKTNGVYKYTLEFTIP